MQLTKGNIDNLKNYIENNEVVYQVCDELIEVSNSENLENRKSLLEYFKHVNSVEVFQKGASFIHEPFEELDNWATQEDCLLLLQIIGVLICIPRKTAVDAKIVLE